MISIVFDTADVTICEIRIFKNSFLPYHRCGSADMPLFSQAEYVTSGSESKEPYYSYNCDPGFDLIGPQRVHCSLNNRWLEEFPVCRPTKTCPLPVANSTGSGLGNETVSFERLYNFTGKLEGVPGLSFLAYSCRHDDEVMLGDSVRICGPDGLWSGQSPICINKTDLTLEIYQKLRKLVSKSVLPPVTLVFNDSADCGIPALPLFAKPVSTSKLPYVQSPLLRGRYSNGSEINYKCESAYAWISGDVGKRVCLDGQWTGKVGKCGRL